MRLILISAVLCLLLARSFAAAPNYITLLDLSSRGGFLRVKSSTFYRVSLINKIEAYVTITTQLEGKEDLVQQYPLDKRILVIVENFRNLATKGLGKSTAKIEFAINGDAYLIASLREKHFFDKLYFERTIERATEHFNRLIDLAQIHSKQGSAEQPATASESKPEGKKDPKPESEGRSQ